MVRTPQLDYERFGQKLILGIKNLYEKDTITIFRTASKKNS